jgi:hypothetical protein
MKKIFVCAIVALISIVSYAQVSVSMNDNGYNVSGGKTNSKEVAAYLEKSLQNLPDYQSVTVLKKKADGTTEVVRAKGAEAFGHGLEIFAGCGATRDAVSADKGFFTPEVGLRYRYDWRWTSITVGASAITRQYNAEAIDAGERYHSYGADLTFGVNIMRVKQSEHILNVFGQGGYLFGAHRKAIEELNGTPLYHNGSGLTYGGGIEYRWQIHATGNALTVRAGYKSVPNTYVNETKHPGMVYMQLGFNFGIKRNRVNTFK